MSELRSPPNEIRKEEMELPRTQDSKYRNTGAENPENRK
jgi:hypothetical protein